MLRDWTIKLGEDEWIIKDVKDVHSTLRKLGFVDDLSNIDDAAIVTVQDGRQYGLLGASLNRVKMELGAVGIRPQSDSS